MTEVSVVRCEDYEKEHCARALLQALTPFGGLKWVKPGMRIVIKANLVSAMKPEKAATTHPALLGALTRLLQERGASVVIGDSPGGLYTAAALNRVYTATGMRTTGAELNADFSKREAHFPEARAAKHFTYTAYLDGADAIISFAKLKSHGMMCLSAATKNLFGAIPGTMKPEYHFRFPKPMDFADMLIDLNAYFQPRLYLVDAVETMEGNGPTAGTPRHMGALLAGRDCHRLDLICAELIGLDPMAVPTLQAAVNRGLLSGKTEDVCVEGNPKEFALADFKRIERGRGLQFETLLPGALGRSFSSFARRALRSSPKVKKSECVGCGLCQRVCPAHAVKVEEQLAAIDYKKCIRCFCCQEFCPKGAMEVHRPLPARLLNR